MNNTSEGMQNIKKTMHENVNKLFFDSKHDTHQSKEDLYFKHSYKKGMLYKMHQHFGGNALSSICLCS